MVNADGLVVPNGPVGGQFGIDICLDLDILEREMRDFVNHVRETLLQSTALTHPPSTRDISDRLTAGSFMGPDAKYSAASQVFKFSGGASAAGAAGAPNPARSKYGDAATKGFDNKHKLSVTRLMGGLREAQAALLEREECVSRQVRELAVELDVVYGDSGRGGGPDGRAALRYGAAGGMHGGDYASYRYGLGGARTDPWGSGTGAGQQAFPNFHIRDAARAWYRACMSLLGSGCRACIYFARAQVGCQELLLSKEMGFGPSPTQFRSGSVDTWAQLVWEDLLRYAQGYVPLGGPEEGALLAQLDFLNGEVGNLRRIRERALAGVDVHEGLNVVESPAGPAASGVAGRGKTGTVAAGRPNALPGLGADGATAAAQVAPSSSAGYASADALTQGASQQPGDPYTAQVRPYSAAPASSMPPPSQPANQGPAAYPTGYAPVDGGLGADGVFYPRR